MCLGAWVFCKSNDNVCFGQVYQVLGPLMVRVRKYRVYGLGFM